MPATRVQVYATFPVSLLPLRPLDVFAPSAGERRLEKLSEESFPKSNKVLCQNQTSLKMIMMKGTLF